MNLFLLGAGMGVVGGVLPSALQMIALAQVALGRWLRALGVLVGAPLVVDGCLLLLTLFFYRLVPPGIAHRVAYVGGTGLVAFASYSLWQHRRKPESQLSDSRPMTYASVSVALLAEVSAPGTWVYWLTIAGPMLAEGHERGYGRVVPFFAGSVAGFYGAAVATLCLLAWGANLHARLKKHLFEGANILLLVMGASYLVRAWRWR